jgi:hypothetical protein
MTIRDIRDRESDPDRFFTQDVPDLHDELRDIFVELSEATVRFHVDFAELGAAYTVELSEEGARISEGPMVDFPVVTLRTDVTEWEVIREHTFELLALGRELFDDRVDLDRVSTLRRDHLDAFESFDGVIALSLRVPEVDAPLESELVLNDYEVFGNPGRFQLSIDVDALYRVARGEASPAEVVRGGELGGDLSLAFDIGGFLLQQFPELSS